MKKYIFEVAEKLYWNLSAENHGVNFSRAVTIVLEAYGFTRREFNRWVIQRYFK